MRPQAAIKIILMLCILGNDLYAQKETTNREAQFQNNQVNVWKTIVYPSSEKILPMHRHDHNRVLVALTNGVLKITNHKGEIHYLTLKKDKAYFLAKDVANEMHMDENISKHAIKVMVIELLN